MAESNRRPRLAVVSMSLLLALGACSGLESSYPSCDDQLEVSLERGKDYFLTDEYGNVGCLRHYERFVAQQ